MSDDLLPIPDTSELTPVATPPTSQLSRYMQKFLASRTALAPSRLTGQVATIRVSETLGAVAYLYERIRNIVEYKNEQVLRRNAIERILKRLLWERASRDSQYLAKVLIRELIWARYLPNDSVPKSKTTEVGDVIAKYLYFLDLVRQNGTPVSFSEIRSWIWGVASCEIEEIFDPAAREPYVLLMYEWFTENFAWDTDHVPEHEQKIQVYLAVHRALTKSDDTILRYHLLLKEVPEWRSNSQELTQALHSRFFALYQEIEKHLVFPDRFALYRIVQKQIAPFKILQLITEKEKENLQAVVSEVNSFEARVREVCQIRYHDIQSKVNRGIFRSILYIFITKVVFALLIEIPYELYRFGTLTYLPLAINVVVPPVMMYLVGLTIRAPGSGNTERILSRLKSIVYDQGQTNKAMFSLLRVKRGSLLGSFFALIYFILFAIVFGGITLLLLRLNFTIPGIGIFFAFLSLVLLFGFRVRFTAQELKITSESENFLSYIFSNLTLPFLRTGMYLSKGLAKINIFTVILDFLIEAPLKTIIEVFEEWTGFMREKREEIVEVPE